MNFIFENVASSFKIHVVKWTTESYIVVDLNGDRLI